MSDPTRAIRTSLATLALGAAFVIPAVAVAASGSIAYVGADGNVQLISPEGGTPRSITSDGAKDAPYISPTAKDDGTIVAGRSRTFSTFTPAGSRLGGPFKLDEIYGSSIGPLVSQVEPRGSRIAYGYMFYNTIGSSGYSPYTTFAHLDRDTGNQEFLEFNSYLSPRWIGTTGKVAAVHGNGSRIAAIDPAGPQNTEVEFIDADQGAPAGERFRSVDVSRDGREVLLVSAPELADSGPATLTLWRLPAVAPALGGSVVCRAQPFGAPDSMARFSPDGSAITWSDDRGVWVSPAPTGSGACNLSPKLIAAGGRHPSWGAAPMSTGGGGAKPKVKLPRTAAPKLGVALRKGLTVRLTGNGVGRVTATASVSGADAKRFGLAPKKKPAVVARAKKKLSRAGAQAVTMKFTAAARKRLAKANRIVLTVRVAVVDAAGGRGTATRRVTLNR